ncbi:MAG: ATP-binding protein [Candidatus Omnitrophica bacterium]|nr:ATP-binding protein [Candidatus Omnitrophota bacterium]MBU1128352.1 ATP-binding protein [Candidatus Omnitrophota bacterium]MBU1657375.1 ATP-binding protein [Candidatus Omnitrophota bacterium]MBU1784772.1 ATP-binding protein [Candidatus Omnitrophota bacterium]MBU1851845.1 ATP-binding protein [Candidatus Omnitrophota bacterium]
MKQIVVISGKGGTGKTILTASFAALAKNKVMADCDVDAADLHLLLAPDVKERHPFKSGKTAVINNDICTACGKCRELCRFEAISKDYIVDPIACEGCAFCSYICPGSAIKMEENTTGEWFVSDTRFGLMVHAKLGIAEENSGKLVSLVRNKAREIAEEKGLDWVIIDGSPGIGCPVIASISGADYALVVTEPTMSGLHDADRVIQVSKHFKVPVKLVINKYDLNLDMSLQIERYCSENDVELSGKIGFDKNVVKAMVEGKTVIEYTDGKTTDQIKKIWEKLNRAFV